MYGLAFSALVDSTLAKAEGTFKCTFFRGCLNHVHNHYSDHKLCFRIAVYISFAFVRCVA